MSRFSPNEIQANFYGALLAPFHDSCLSTTKRGGRDLTYIDSRTLGNRLDSVCGPHGWSVEYRKTKRGYLARMGIRCPVTENPADPESPLHWEWIFKEDGAGFEEMGAVNKATGEFEYDVDNDEKSAYTNAFRRVAQNAWGIARYLYKKGIPDFLDPNAQAPAVRSSSAAPAGDATATVGRPAAPRPSPSRPPAASAPAPAPAAAPPPRAAAPPAAPAQQQAPPAPPASGQDRKFDNFQIPKPGRAVFAWAKAQEELFQTSLINGMKNDGEKLGYGSMFANWNQEQVNEVCMSAIRHIATLDNYAREYDHLLANDPPSGNAPPLPAPAAAPAAPAAGAADIVAARADASAALTENLAEAYGRKPTVPELKAAVAEYSASVPNASGSTGEVMASIGACNDATWLRNLQRFLVALTKANREQAAAPSEEIPF